MTVPELSLIEVSGFLGQVHGTVVSDVVPLAGGFWSKAFGYRAGARDLVLRLGSVREGFEMDRAAMMFAGPELPIPEVLEIGDAFGVAYAISERHYGRPLETVGAGEAARVAPAIDSLLSGLRGVQGDHDGGVSWFDKASTQTWRAWLLNGLIDNPDHRVNGWRATLARDPDLDRLFRTCEGRIGELVEACPERRDLVHGDLLNANVLVSEDGSQVTAVFSWKCSTFGDFLFDVAWCTFWGGWHAGIAAVDVWALVTRDPSLSREELADAPTRHHCYELQIGASHLGWHAWTRDQAGLRAVADRTTHILSRGPLSVTEG